MNILRNKRAIVSTAIARYVVFNKVATLYRMIFIVRSQFSTPFVFLPVAPNPRKCKEAGVSSTIFASVSSR